MQNRRIKPVWLMGTPILVLLIFAVMPVGRAAWRYYYLREKSVSIGYFKDSLAQQRAGLKTLSSEMRAYPQFNTYKILSSSPHFPKE
ncbi:MAG TPA: hypothetical protein VF719_08615, partial [Abditibacteriaceae bacterium]